MNRFLNSLIAVLVIGSCLTSIGCGGGDSQNADTPLTGRWELEYEFKGTGVSGTTTVTGGINDADGILSGIIEGTHDGEAVSFTYTRTMAGPSGSSTWTYRCVGTYNGGYMSGDMTVTAVGGTVGSGTFSGTRE